jgi:hypothetical protein
VCASIIFHTPYIALTGAGVLVGFTLIYFMLGNLAKKES